ncbi:hypothetical protein [Desulfatiglans anilini]|uniref:phage tail tube protein n=1 Tax=Desulfatiglans anilini TaxID=90728 RepID=UPI0003FABE1A|nr:hypothetical protein [Desulfatiglans anilini]
MPIATSPSTELYTIGKGIMYMADWDGATPPDEGDLGDVGNCPELGLELSVEEKEHYSSRSGAKNLDKSTTIQKGYKLNFSLDEMATKNLERFLMGTAVGDKIAGLTNTQREVWIRFISDNAEGPNRQWDFWRVKLRPNGAGSLIGEEWMTLPHAGEGLSDVANHPTSPFFDVDAQDDEETTTTEEETTTTV